MTGSTARALYQGDEISAAGWRLAGAEVLIGEPGREAEALDAARARAALVLVSAAVAGRIDGATLRRALAAPTPLVLVVPDPQGQAAPPDLASRLRTQLGLEA